MRSARILAGSVAVAACTQIVIAVNAEAADWQDAGCSSTWLCLYKDANWNLDSGSTSEFDSRNEALSNYSVNLGGTYGFNDKMSSWISLRSKYSRWYFDAWSGGSSRCMKPNWVVASVTSSENDKASSIVLYGNATVC